MDILTLSPKSTSLFTIFQKNNCYRSTTLLFGLGQTIMLTVSQWANDSNTSLTIQKLMAQFGIKVCYQKWNPMILKAHSLKSLEISS